MTGTPALKAPCQQAASGQVAVRSLMTGALIVGCLLLSGCISPQAPAFYLAGSYFPSWLIGTAVGIVLMIPIRWLLIRTGIDDALPLRLLFYTCVVLIIAMAFSYAFSPQ
ncbi:YtcA family lipoprotein [Orrella marina]|nr:YtcA family lipoprotein [Orrella marina]